MNKQIKSKKRVADHGEVFTNEREVKAMLDLVDDQCQQIEKTFLEPACGNGNFLIEVLNRKLALLNGFKRITKHNPDYTNYTQNIVHIATTLYGVDILPDNVEQCRERLFQAMISHMPLKLRKMTMYQDLIKTLHFILEKNIVCGDAINYRKNNGLPIVFYEWKFVDTKVKIRCFDFEVVAETEKQIALFSEKNEMQRIPNHHQEFEPKHYLKLYDYAEK